jgi:membrane associated rhomboid family serine protease
MIDASVGFQCPECVAEANKGVRQPRTIFGGRTAADPGYVSKGLIGLNVLLFLFQQLPVGSELTHRLWVVGGPVIDPLLAEPVGVADGEYYRLLSAAFLHTGLLHLLLNMYALFLFGPALERAFGRARFTILYVVAALGGTAASYAFSDPGQPSLGASGAVFGLMGALLVVGRRLGADPRTVLILLAVNLAFPLVVRGTNIDWRAHLGGLVAGVLCSLALAGSPTKRWRAVQVAGIVGIVLVILALVLWRTAQLTS